MWKKAPDVPSYIKQLKWGGGEVNETKMFETLLIRQRRMVIPERQKISHTTTTIVPGYHLEKVLRDAIC